MSPVDRRSVLRACVPGSLLAISGCLSDNPPSIPLRFERVINFTDSPLPVELTIRSKSDGEKYDFSKLVRPIDSDPSAEWLLEPTAVDNTFDYVSEIRIEEEQQYTFDHEQLLAGQSEDLTEEHCMNLSWFIRDPATDVAPLPELTTTCGPIESN